ncbi:MAG: WYL domain-containing protein [Opitutaceae bacterium]|nr:WYL domain-containing protein [Opitutaceae bacterium]
MAKAAKLPNSRPPVARMIRIHEELQDGRLTNCPKLAKLLEVSTKTIARDLEFMRDQLGLPVEYDATIYAWRYAYPVKNFPTVQINEGELLALLVAQKALEQYRGTPYHDQLAHAFEKLSAGLRDQISFSPSGGLANVSFHHLGLGKADLKIFETLTRAVHAQREIEFTYRKPQSKADETRQMQPYHLANRENAWYLLGRDCGKDALRTFAVGRIKSVKLGHRSFTRPPEFSPEQFYARTFGAFVGYGDHRVVLRFEAGAADQIRERFWHESQEFKELPEGRLEMSLHLGSLDEIQRWVLGWGPQAEVVQPAELRQAVKTAALATAERY